MQWLRWTTPCNMSDINSLQNFEIAFRGLLQTIQDNVYLCPKNILDTQRDKREIEMCSWFTTDLAWRWKPE